MRLLRRKVDSSIEDRLLTAFIVSTQFCKEIIPLTNIDYFQGYHKKVVEWVSEYYTKYKKAPDKHIKEIFEYNKTILKEDESENIGLFLSRLSDKYEKDEKFNADYFIDQAVNYYREQSVKLMVDRSKLFLEMGKVDEAEEVIRDYKKVSKEISEWVNPFDSKFVRKTLLDDEERNVLFSFPGVLGQVVGKLERDWLVGVLGPMKRGKTWYLQEFAAYGLFEKLNVVFISLEMSANQVAKRIYKRIAAYGDVEKDYVYPVFDCKWNQEGTCKLSDRTNHVKLLNEKGEKPTFKHNMEYQPCTACRGKRKRYIPETWFTTHERKKLKIKNIVERIEKMEGIYGTNLRLLCYPAYSANMARVKRDLDKLEYLEGFVPDVIIIDYADILTPEDQRLMGRERIDETWKTLRNLSQTRHCLVVTASQSNRASIKKKNVTQEDTAEDIRKIAHVNMMISLNQLREEKHAGVMRIAVIAHRDKDFDQLSQCIVLQQLELGQPQLDSEFCNDYEGLRELREKVIESENNFVS